MGRLSKIKILIVGSPSVARVIAHLFHGRAEFEVVGTISGFESLGQQSGQLVPELIVANVKPVSTGIRRVVSAIKQSSPLSKLILTCAVEDLSHLARKSGADAYLNDEKLASHLLRVARTLADRPTMSAAGVG